MVESRIDNRGRKKVIDFSFNEIGFNRVYVSHAHENPASGKVMQKCRMVYKGIMRQAVRPNDNIYYDKVNYNILADDYRKISLQFT